mmetsp:Transcript_3209/g.10731  ORF Transcript_3209/g.10731 Transcript_3209/m.10731 type:complete len:248 (+) Transcript_3209:829-1572(+)
MSKSIRHVGRVAGRRRRGDATRVRGPEGEAMGRVEPGVDEAGARRGRDADRRRRRTERAEDLRAGRRKDRLGKRRTHPLVVPDEGPRELSPRDVRLHGLPVHVAALHAAAVSRRDAVHVQRDDRQRDGRGGLDREAADVHAGVGRRFVRTFGRAIRAQRDAVAVDRVPRDVRPRQGVREGARVPGDRARDDRVHGGVAARRGRARGSNERRRGSRDVSHRADAAARETLAVVAVPQREVPPGVRPAG